MQTTSILSILSPISTQLLSTFRFLCVSMNQIHIPFPLWYSVQRTLCFCGWCMSASVPYKSSSALSHFRTLEFWSSIFSVIYNRHCDPACFAKLNSYFASRFHFRLPSGDLILSKLLPNSPPLIYLADKGFTRKKWWLSYVRRWRSVVRVKAVIF